MTKVEWLASEDPAAMLRFLQGFNEPQSKTFTGRLSCCTDRKLNLFISACSGVDDVVEDAPLGVAMAWVQDEGSVPEKQIARAALLREIFGNPFRPLTWERVSVASDEDSLGNTTRETMPGINPTWLTSTVVSLARHIYDTRDFAAMLFLADSLEDGGCTDQDVLHHCQGGGPHVRGCWGIDCVVLR